MSDPVAAILAPLAATPTLARYLGAARQLDALAEAEPERFARRTVHVLRNVTIEPIEPLLRVAGYRRGLRLELSYSGYDPGAADAIGDRSPDAVLLLLGLDELAPRLAEAGAPGERTALGAEVADHVLALARDARDRTGAPVVVHTFAAPVAPVAGLADAQDPAGQVTTVRALNQRLAEGVAALDGAFLLDLDHLLAGVGYAAAHDARGARTAGAPFSLAALRALAEAQARHLRALDGPQVKCLVLDCDDTLWRGVVGEDGLAGLAMGADGPGRPHHELQRDLLALRRRGTLLALCSKNEREDVLAVLREHPDCGLGLDDIAALRIDWQDKAEHVAAIAAELGLGLEHVAFLDDSPAECARVAAALPAVRVLRFPEDLDGGRLDDLGLFDTLGVTAEDTRRTELYRAEAQRREVRGAAGSVEEHLRGLELRATVGRATPARLPRLAQLCARTNQFNLTTRRHDLAGLTAMQADPDVAITWLELEDRFGASGLVGCAIVRRDGDEAALDTLLLSCRVIGRGAESVLLCHAGSLAADMGATTLAGEYVPSTRNGQVADLYPRLGFTGPEGGPWRWPLADGPPAAPDWIAVTEAGA